MITELTPEHKKLISVYAHKWTEIGLSTESANRQEAEEGGRIVYKMAGLKEPKIVWCGSPLSAGIARTITFCAGDSLRGSVWGNVRKAIRASIESSNAKCVSGYVQNYIEFLYMPYFMLLGLNNFSILLRNAIEAISWNLVRDSVRGSVCASVQDSLGKSVSLNIRASVWYSSRDSVWPACKGVHDAGWIAYYDYCNSAFGLKNEDEKLNGFFKIAKNSGWYLPYEKIVWISERHNVCNLRNRTVHCDGGPAIAYPDGFSIWALNGVLVSQKIAETKAEDLNADMILTEKNLEVRKEIVRKIGIERVLMQLGAKSIEKNSDYELFKLNKIKINNRHPVYLKMKNPSIGVYHVEEVSAHTKTIRETLHFRKPERLQAIPVDDVNGLDWYQQGDVCIYPKDAHSVKFSPKILT